MQSHSIIIRYYRYDVKRGAKELMWIVVIETVIKTQRRSVHFTLVGHVPFSRFGFSRLYVWILFVVYINFSSSASRFCHPPCTHPLSELHATPFKNVTLTRRPLFQTSPTKWHKNWVWKSSSWPSNFQSKQTATVSVWTRERERKKRPF